MDNINVIAVLLDEDPDLIMQLAEGADRFIFD